jgi:hypothetical protein
MKNLLKTSAIIAVSAFVAFSGATLRADNTTASSPDKPAAGGTPGSTDSKNQENTPAGPTAQGDTGTTGTPQQTKTGDGATTDKPLTSVTDHPNEATKKLHRHHHHHVSATSAVAAPSTPVTPAVQ